jgi:hypothetical protein
MPEAEELFGVLAQLRGDESAGRRGLFATARDVSRQRRACDQNTERIKDRDIGRSS